MKELNLISPIGYTGYGIAGLNILKSLVKNYSVTLFPKGQPSIDTQEDVGLVKGAIDSQEDINKFAPCLKIWHQFDLAEHVGNGLYCAFPFFELDAFKKLERSHLMVPDHILVTSEWAKKVILDANIRDEEYVSVVPLGVDPTLFNIHDLAPKKPRNSFVVLNAGKWEYRKGHDLIPEIFSKAFDRNDNVELWMLPHNPFLNEQETKEWTNRYEKCDLAEKVWILPRQSRHLDLRNVMSMADIGLFPSRAEGWNLELLEMMAIGKNVIATNYSAHTQFCDRDNAMLIDIDNKEVARDGKWFHGDGSWAALGKRQVDQAVEYLRSAYKIWKQNPTTFSNLNGAKTASQLTWDNTANIIAKHMGLN